jgi:acyl carrier protein
MNEIQTISDRIRDFVLGEFPLARKRGIKDSDPLLESGIVDSMGVLEIVAFLESEFSFQISDEELVPENFKNIEQLTAFVNGRRTTDTRSTS